MNTGRDSERDDEKVGLTAQEIARIAFYDLHVKLEFKEINTLNFGKDKLANQYRFYRAADDRQFNYYDAVQDGGTTSSELPTLESLLNNIKMEDKVIHVIPLYEARENRNHYVTLFLYKNPKDDKLLAYIFGSIVDSDKYDFSTVFTALNSCLKIDNNNIHIVHLNEQPQKNDVNSGAYHLTILRRLTQLRLLTKEFYEEAFKLFTIYNDSEDNDTNVVNKLDNLNASKMKAMFDNYHSETSKSRVNTNNVPSEPKEKKEYPHDKIGDFDYLAEKNGTKTKTLSHSRQGTVRYIQDQFIKSSYEFTEHHNATFNVALFLYAWYQSFYDDNSVLRDELEDKLVTLLDCEREKNIFLNKIKFMLYDAKNTTSFQAFDLKLETLIKLSIELNDNDQSIVNKLSIWGTDNWMKVSLICHNMLHIIAGTAEYLVKFAYQFRVEEQILPVNRLGKMYRLFANDGELKYGKIKKYADEHPSSRTAEVLNALMKMGVVP